MMMDYKCLRIWILLAIVYVTVANIERDGGTNGQTDDGGSADATGQFWRPNLYQRQPDLIVDDVPGEFYRYQSRPSYRPYPHRNPQRPPLGSALSSSSPFASGDDTPAAADVEYDADANKELENMPFGVQNVRSVLPVRPTRTRPATPPAPSRVTFQSLCPSRHETTFLNLMQSEYEYRPNHYDEVYCVHPYTNHRTYTPASNKVEQGVCGDVGFNCIQLNRTIFLTRKAIGTDCWESETRLIPAGCECMWPKHHFGDIGGHH